MFYECRVLRAIGYWVTTAFVLFVESFTLFLLFRTRRRGGWELLFAFFFTHLLLWGKLSIAVLRENSEYIEWYSFTQVEIWYFR